MPNVAIPRRILAFVVLVTAFISSLVVFGTLSIALSPFDEPNLYVVPFLPGIALYSLIKLGHPGNVPDNGIAAAFIAAVNALFYAALIIAISSLLLNRKNSPTSPDTHP